MLQKEIIGMVHVKALPASPKNELSMDEIINDAKYDLEVLSEAGFTAAIIENFHDVPYTRIPSLETLIALTTVFNRIKEFSDISLGINIQSTDGVEEMIVATIVGADFIRAETFVETRLTSSGVLNPMCAALMRKKRELDSKVLIYADINVKHSHPLTEISVKELVHEAVSFGADKIILTGGATGVSPNTEDAKFYKELCKETPLLIGSGVNEENIKELLAHADGVIVGSSIKENGIVENPVSLERCKNLIRVCT